MIDMRGKLEARMYMYARKRSGWGCLEPSLRAPGYNWDSGESRRNAETVAREREGGIYWAAVYDELDGVNDKRGRVKDQIGTP